MRAALAIVVAALLPLSGLAAQPDLHQAAPVKPAPVTPGLVTPAPETPAPMRPRPVPGNGTVIKPAGPVDPGIQAKTPSATHFPTPVIRPRVPVEPSPR